MSKLVNLIFILICCLTTNAFAAVYKCDANGRISYQDTKCDHGVETITNLQTHTTTNAKVDANSKDKLNNTLNSNSISQEPIENNSPATIGSAASNSQRAASAAPPSPVAPPVQSPSHKLNNIHQNNPTISRE